MTGSGFTQSLKTVSMELDFITGIEEGFSALLDSMRIIQDFQAPALGQTYMGQAGFKGML